MSLNSQIEWTEATWNPVTGCTKISSGCLNCYAERMAKRLKAMGNPRYRNCFKVTLHEDLLSKPLQWKKPRLIFVNSMSDLFHEDVPDSFILKTFEIMNMAKQHTFQVLTKRSGRLKSISHLLNWTPNIWQGVSVENNANKFRINDLRKVPAEVRFISFEPLIGEVKKPNLNKIHWAIVGGESGPGARQMKKEWVESLLKDCQTQNVPFFFKQWGGTQKYKNGRTLNGQVWDEYPNIYVADN